MEGQEVVLVLVDRWVQVAVEGICLDLEENVGRVDRNIQVEEDHREESQVQAQRHQEVDHNLSQIDLAEVEGRNRHIAQEEDSSAMEVEREIRLDWKEDLEMEPAEDLGFAVEDPVEKSSGDKMSAAATPNIRL